MLYTLSHYNHYQTCAYKAHHIHLSWTGNKLVGTKAKTLDSNATGIVKNPREPCDVTSHFEKMKVTKSIKNACMNVYDSEKVKSNQIACTSNDKISEPWPEHLVPPK